MQSMVTQIINLLGGKTDVNDSASGPKCSN
jgi:hypothetical protein